MKRCPICSRDHETAVCPDCGYDPSVDYESYPTLCPVPAATAVRSRRKADWAHRFPCPHCGSTLFSYCPEEGILQCATCQYRHPIQMQQPMALPQEKIEGTVTFGNTIAVGEDMFVAICADGTAIAHGREVCRDAMAVAISADIAVVLKQNGHVQTDGWGVGGQGHAGSWREIMSISAGDNHIVGLKANHSVVAVGWDFSGQCDTQSWKDIVAIAAGNEHTVGLQQDGRVVATGKNWSGQCNTKSWREIIAIAAEGDRTVALRSDGHVLVSGNDRRTRGWREIVAIAAGKDHIIGLRKNGTVVAAGENNQGQCDTQSWCDIAAITAGPACTIGIKQDGSVVVAGQTDFRSLIEHLRIAVPGTPVPRKG